MKSSRYFLIVPATLWTVLVVAELIVWRRIGPVDLGFDVFYIGSAVLARRNPAWIRAHFWISAITLTAIAFVVLQVPTAIALPVAYVPLTILSISVFECRRALGRQNRAKKDRIRVGIKTLRVDHVEIPYAEVQKVIAYKINRFNKDMIRIDVEWDGGTVTLKEEDLQFEEAVDALEKNLPAFRTEWKEAVLNPRYLKNQITLFART